MRYLSVFCGAKLGNNPEFLACAKQLGESMAENGFGLVYGGASIGIMGEIANSVLNAGGEAVGVIPRSMLRKEVAHQSLTQLHTVETMHQRKQLMSDLSSGVIALPGGYGTLDELFESLTWNQLGNINMPCALLNCAGYFNALIEFIETAVQSELIKPKHRELLWVETEAQPLIRRFAQHELS